MSIVVMEQLRVYVRIATAPAQMSCAVDAMGVSGVVWWLSA